MAGMKRRLVITEQQQRQLEAGLVDGLCEDGPWDDAVRRFLEGREALGKSPWTVKYYRDRLRALAGLLEAQGVPLDPRSIRTTHIEKNVSLFSQRQGAKRKTINGRLVTLKAFFGYLYQQGLVQSDPTVGVKLLPKEEREPRSIEPEHLPKLLAACDQTRFTGVRDYAMLMVLLDTGLRLKELLSLCVQDVRLRAGELVVRGMTKSRKERRVPFGANCRRALDKWLTVRGEIPGVDEVFTTTENQPLARRSIYQVMNRIAKHAGVPAELVHPHAFRHTMARLYIENGGDPYSLQDLLGHADQSTTSLYVKFFSDDLKERHARFSPVENLLGTSKRDAVRSRRIDPHRGVRRP